MSSQLADNFLEQLLLKKIDFAADVFKIILMDSGFVFDRVVHTAYSSVSVYELDTALGYTVGGATLAGVAVTEDNTAHCGKVSWNTAAWTATGGNLVASGAVIYDDTTAIKYIVGYLDFEGPQTTLDTGVASVSTPTVRISG